MGRCCRNGSLMTPSQSTEHFTNRVDFQFSVRGPWLFYWPAGIPLQNGLVGLVEYSNIRYDYPIYYSIVDYTGWNKRYVMSFGTQGIIRCRHRIHAAGVRPVFLLMIALREVAGPTLRSICLFADFVSVLHTSLTSIDDNVEEIIATSTVLKRSFTGLILSHFVMSKSFRKFSFECKFE